MNFIIILLNHSDLLDYQFIDIWHTTQSNNNLMCPVSYTFAALSLSASFCFIDSVLGRRGDLALSGLSIPSTGRPKAENKKMCMHNQVWWFLCQINILSNSIELRQRLLRIFHFMFIRGTFTLWLSCAILIVLAFGVNCVINIHWTYLLAKSQTRTLVVNAL